MHNLCTSIMKSLEVKSITDRILHICIQNCYFKNTGNSRGNPQLENPNSLPGCMTTNSTADVHSPCIIINLFLNV